VARSSATTPPPSSVLLTLRLPPVVARARAAPPGPRSTSLGPAPSTCGRTRPRVHLRSVHHNTSLLSSVHHSVALRHSRRGLHSHLPWRLTRCLELRLHSHCHGHCGLRSGTHGPSPTPLARWSSPTPTPPPTGWQTPMPPATPHPTLVTSTLLALLLLTLPPSLLVMALLCPSPQ
jgi:hypothetical protein